MIDYACMYIIYHVLPENGNQKQIHLKQMPGQCGRNAPRCQSTMTAPAQPRGESFRLHHHTSWPLGQQGHIHRTRPTPE